MARIKRAIHQSKITTDGQMTRLPLTMKPANNVAPISHPTAINQPSNMTTGDSAGSASSLTYETSSNMTAAGGKTSTSSKDQTLSSTFTSPTLKTNSSASDKTTSSISTKIKITKTKTKTEIINCKINSNDDNENDDDAYYDLQTSIDESGGLEQFLKTPCMILYKRNLKNQKDIEKYVLQHLSSYNENLCEFPGIKGNNDLKKNINEFYRHHRKTSMSSTILFKNNPTKTTSTQEIILQNGNLYLYVDEVMKKKTSKKKKKKVSVDLDAAPAPGDCGNVKADGHEYDPTADEDEDEHSEEVEEINISTSGARKRSINRKGGSKNCGLYLLYRKKEEVRECVNNILSYGRDHGILMSGVQLKALLDIQNVEMTKQRAETLVQLVASAVDVVCNPHFVPPTSKKPVYEYYGSGYQLDAVHPTKSIPIPTTIIEQYKEKDKKKEVDGCDKSWNENEVSDITIEETNAQSSSDEDVQETIQASEEKLIEQDGNKSIFDEIKEIEETNINCSIESDNNVKSNGDMGNHTMDGSDVFDEEAIVNDNTSSPLIDSSKDLSNKNSFISSTNHDIITHQVETPVKKLITPSSSPIADKVDYLSMTDPNSRSLSQPAASSAESTNSLPMLVHDLKQTTTSHLPPPSSTSSVSSNDQTSSSEPSHSNPHQHSNSTGSIIETVPPLQQQLIKQPAKLKTVRAKKVAARRKPSNGRRSIALRSKAKIQQQQTSTVIHSKRKQDDEQSDPTSSNSPTKRKKLNNDGKSAVPFQKLPKIPKKTAKTLKITSSTDNN